MVLDTQKFILESSSHYYYKVAFNNLLQWSGVEWSGVVNDPTFTSQWLYDPAQALHCSKLLLLFFRDKNDKCMRWLGQLNSMLSI